ncbi:hypothetical protein [Streptomyces bluensis]|uniref:hypothetical protein n=1 Tax=Streptomyces bluensis TaxID=33897 RepID=UPI001064045D|nr:hypothetical protein [Streptomyces bluensis]GGZ51063.1 hypothetical protein GCM10010344_16250 [Streptomyces bluensis]
MIAVAETSGLLTLFNRSDSDHPAARKSVGRCSLLVATPLSLTEVRHVATARAGRAVANAVLTRDLRDFRAIRPIGSTYTYFRILPDDAD